MSSELSKREPAVKKTLDAERTRVLRSVYEGADVWSRRAAVICREMARSRPPLVTIVKAKHAPADGAAKQPYFGCIATWQGRELLAQKRAARKHEV